MIMKIIYLSPDVSEYGGAFYQQDIIEEFKRQHQVFFYGPRFPSYNKNDSIMDVISKSPFNNPDLICIGHAWLEDYPDADVDRHPNINLSKLEIPRVMILNKEYTNLEKKLDYIVDSNIDVVFTHHHDIEYYKKRTGVKFVFWPFAVNHNNFKDYGLNKEYDLTFTGLLRNPTFPQTQTDVRIRVQNKLFYCLGELRLFKRLKYRKYNFFWRACPTSKKISRISRIIHKDKRLLPSEYFKLLNRSRVCFNALSPLDLIGPRYYESMASKCLVLCQRSPVYKDIFEDGKHCVMFNDDLSDFDEKLFYYLENEEKREKIVERAYHHVLNNHTWEKRISQFTDEVKREFYL